MTYKPTGREVYCLHLNERYVFEANREHVWRVLSNVEHYPMWWRWLREYTVEGEPSLQQGTALVGLVVPPIPYRFRVGIRLNTIVEESFIGASLFGDLDGPASISFEPEQGDRCAMTIRWDVEMLKPSMRAAAHISKPLLVWGHDQVVDVTAKTFSERVLQGAATSG